jgi:hypothetical protein
LSKQPKNYKKLNSKQRAADESEDYEESNVSPVPQTDGEAEEHNVKSEDGKTDDESQADNNTT